MAISFGRLRAISKQSKRRADRQALINARHSGSGTTIQIQQQTVSKYVVGGTKVKKGNTNIVEISVYEKTGHGGTLVVEKKSEGTDLQTVYSALIDFINLELSSKQITDVVLPTLDELRG